MKIEQKAIEEIQNQFKCIGIDYTNNKDVTAIAVAHGEMAEAVIKALEKQIPKEPIEKESGWYYCPTCNTKVPASANYCCGYYTNKQGCGQALEWSKNEIESLEVKNENLDEYYSGICPRCGKEITKLYKPLYCEVCGQALRWSN